MGITTSTQYGRAKISWPDYAHEGGTALHTKITNSIDAIADHLGQRWFGPITLADTASQDLAHNFDMNLSELDVRIVESDVILTLEQQSVYTIAEKTGNEKNEITITNNSGGSKTFDVYVFGYSLEKLLGRHKSRTLTTDATPTNLLSIAIPTDEVVGYKATITARINGTNANYYEYTGIVENNGGTATNNFVTNIQHEDNTSLDIQVSTSGANLLIKGVGVAATNIEWFCLLQKTYY